MFRNIYKSNYEICDQNKTGMSTIEIKIITTIQHGLFCFWLNIDNYFASLKLHDKTSTILDNYIPRGLCASFGTLKNITVQCYNWELSDETDTTEFINIVGLYHLCNFLPDSLKLLSWIHTKMLPQIMTDMAPINFTYLTASATPATVEQSDLLLPSPPEKNKKKQENQSTQHQVKVEQNQSPKPSLPIQKPKAVVQLNNNPLQAVKNKNSKPKPESDWRWGQHDPRNDWRWGDCKYGKCNHSNCY